MKRRIYLKMQPWEEALGIFLKRVNPSRYDKKEVVSVRNCLGRITAEPIFAKLSSPHYHSAAMDGIALLAQVSFGATEDRPKRLKVGEEGFLVNTGDPLPPGTDAVLMIEEVQQIDSTTVEIMRAAHPWQNVRTIGEDLVATELILSQGHRITPYDMGALLAGGVMEVSVKRKPKVVVIPTGDEVVSPEEALPRGPREGEIVDLNSTILAGLIEEAGGEYIPHPIVKDDPNEIKEAILSASREESDVILINAGSSAGSEDFTASIIEELGDVLVHGVAVMPGKPSLLGIIDKKPIVGIPGYSVSAVLSFELFVQPLLAAMLGLGVPQREKEMVVATRRLPSKLGVEEFVRPSLYLSSNHVGSLEGIIALKKGNAHMAGSHLLDPVTGEYNIPYIQRYLSGVKVKLVHLAYRQQGFMLPLGNPKGIRDLSDLLHGDVRFINRQRGSGTRVLLDYLLEQERIDSTQIKGYAEEEFTHLGVAVAVSSGRADVGLGIHGAAKALGLDFVPLEKEQYDLIIPRNLFDDPNVQLVIEVLRSEEFREQIEELGGYDCSRMGEHMEVQ